MMNPVYVFFFVYVCVRIFFLKYLSPSILMCSNYKLINLSQGIIKQIMAFVSYIALLFFDKILHLCTPLRTSNLACVVLCFETIIIPKDIKVLYCVITSLISVSLNFGFFFFCVCFFF